LARKMCRKLNWSMRLTSYRFNGAKTAM
jgi:hypothetical protein